MTPLPALFEKVREACPCADDERKGCSYRNGISCHCVTHGLGHHKCGWPGHAALDEIAERQHANIGLGDSCTRPDCAALRRACRGEK